MELYVLIVYIQRHQETFVHISVQVIVKDFSMKNAEKLYFKPVNLEDSVIDLSLAGNVMTA